MLQNYLLDGRQLEEKMSQSVKALGPQAIFIIFLYKPFEIPSWATSCPGSHGATKVGMNNKNSKRIF